MVLTTLFTALALPQSPPATTYIVPRTPLRVAGQAEKRISIRVNNASLKEVFDKLPKVNFALDPDDFAGRRITLNLSDVPLSEALSAIASAMNAHWEAVGGVRILKKGPGNGFDGTSFRTFTSPGSSKGFELFDKGLSPEALKSFQDAQKRLFKDGRTFQSFSLEQQKALQKALEDARKQRENAKELRGDDAKARVRASTINVDALLKSITPEQKGLAKSQGYLKVSDLSPEQRKMAGIEEGGTIEIVITRDGETLRIKS